MSDTQNKGFPSVQTVAQRRIAWLMIVGILLAVRFWRPMLHLFADEWQEARTAVMARYQDDSIIAQARTTTAAQARVHLSEVLDLIDNHYYEPVDWRNVANNALLHFQAALQIQVVVESLELTPDQIIFLTQELERLRAELANAQESWTTKQMLDVADEVLSLTPNSQLEDVWVLTEWGYDVTENLDGYSYLLSPRQYQAMQDRLAGTYTGVGIDLIIRGEYPRLFDVVQDGPAARAGMRPGDWMYAINGVDCRGRDAAFVTALLTAKHPDGLQLTLRRGEQEYAVKVRSELLSAPCVRNVQTFNVEQKTGFLRISGFDCDTAMELRRSLDDLTQRGIKGLIIDLRSNGGGVMNAAIESARLFLDAGTIVTVISGTERTRYVAGGSGKASDIPLVLLVDENTASAAEIFAAALRDNGRAVVIGDKTFGKARIQTIFPMTNNATGICITTAGYLPPGNEDFNQIGLTPDIKIQNVDADAKTPLCVTDLIRNDNVSLQAALIALAGR